jgi:hypothetical protein
MKRGIHMAGITDAAAGGNEVWKSVRYQAAAAALRVRRFRKSRP